eukprot:m51a1_g9064 hypothetical protein (467) ;mRNA; f:85163-86762
MSRQYSEAAELLSAVLACRGSARTLAFSLPNLHDRKACYALVVETLKCRAVVEPAAEAAGLLPRPPAVFGRGDRARCLVMLMVHDLLFARRGIQGGGVLKRAIKEREKALREYAEKHKETAVAAPPADTRPVYARVNTILCSAASLPEEVRALSPAQDALIAEVFCVPPESGAALRACEAVAQRKVIVQSKPSCMPARALNPTPGATVIDACAAPGNKTCHLAAIMNNQGKVYAFDRDEQRLLTMRELMKASGATIVDAQHADWLSTDPHDPKYSPVEFILVDPSCSGSGMLDRPERLAGRPAEAERVDKTRLLRLRRFQLQAVRHAMSFPNVRRVVYSTCSVHREENEEVVYWALKTASPEWHLARVLPEWHGRGVPNDELKDADKCVRVDPDKDGMTGFFVACFERELNANGNSTAAAAQQTSEKPQREPVAAAVQEEAADEASGAMPKKKKRRVLTWTEHTTK